MHFVFENLFWIFFVNLILIFLPCFVNSIFNKKITCSVNIDSNIGFLSLYDWIFIVNLGFWILHTRYVRKVSGQRHAVLWHLSSFRGNPVCLNEVLLWESSIVVASLELSFWKSCEWICLHLLHIVLLLFAW